MCVNVNIYATFKSSVNIAICCNDIFILSQFIKNYY